MAFLAAAGAAGAAGGLGTALSVGATLFSVAGSLIGAAGEAKAAKFNAQVESMKADQALQQGAIKASEQARKTRQTLAAGRAGAQANGFELGGSITDVLDQAETQGNLDYLTSVYDGRVQATNFQNNAMLYNQQAKNAKIKGFIGAGTQLFSGLNSLSQGRSQLSV